MTGAVMDICPPESELNTMDKFQCTEKGCASEFIAASQFKMHLVKHHRIGEMTSETKGLKCRYFCPRDDCAYNIRSESKKYFTMKRLLKQHFMKVHADKNYICDQCGFKSSMMSTMNRHKKVCGVTYFCEECGWKYSSHESLLVHLMRKHPSMHKSYLESKLTKLKSQQRYKCATENKNSVVEKKKTIHSSEDDDRCKSKVASHVNNIPLEHDYYINLFSSQQNNQEGVNNSNDSLNNIIAKVENSTIIHDDDEIKNDFELILPRKDVEQIDTNLGLLHPIIITTSKCDIKCQKDDSQDCQKIINNTSSKGFLHNHDKKPTVKRDKNKNSSDASTQFSYGHKRSGRKKNSIQNKIFKSTQNPSKNNDKNFNFCQSPCDDNSNIITYECFLDGDNFNEYFNSCDSKKHLIMCNNENIEFSNNNNYIEESSKLLADYENAMKNEVNRDKYADSDWKMLSNINSVDFGCQFDVENVMPNSYDIETQTTFDELCYNIDLFPESISLSDVQTQTTSPLLSANLSESLDTEDLQISTSVSMETQTPWPVQSFDYESNSVFTQTSEFLSSYNLDVDDLLNSDKKNDPILICAETQTSNLLSQFDYGFDLDNSKFFNKNSSSNLISAETQTSASTYNCDYDFANIDRNSLLTSAETQTMDMESEDTLDFMYDIEKTSPLFESTSPYYCFKETQTCFCFMDSPQCDDSDNLKIIQNLSLVDGEATHNRCNCLGHSKFNLSTSTETQTQISFKDAPFFNRKSDVLLSYSSIETQTCSEDTYLDEIINDNEKDI